MVKILTELGLTAGHPGLAAALDHLEEHSIIDGGVSTDGRRGEPADRGATPGPTA